MAGVGELDRIVPSSPPEFTAAKVGESGPECPSFLLQNSMFNRKPGLEARGELWDVIALVRGREEKHTIRTVGSQMSKNCCSISFLSKLGY